MQAGWPAAAAAAQRRRSRLGRRLASFGLGSARRVDALHRPHRGRRDAGGVHYPRRRWRGALPDVRLQHVPDVCFAHLREPEQALSLRIIWCLQ